MEHKVLIADDSLTIQKVIKITLSNEPFELKDCPDAANLVGMVKEFEPAMVLLDFNLSENKTGYDLCREIKSINPNIGVLMLFGTFDNIDEELLSDCGCNYHIVKPFDGTKFINLCRALASDFGSEEESSSQVSDEIPEEIEHDFLADEPEEEEISEDATTEFKNPFESIPEEISPENDSEDSSEEEAVNWEADADEEIEEDENEEEDEWVVNQPMAKDETSDEELEEEADQEPEAANSEKNQLLSEMEDWGMEIPSIIGDASGESALELPGVIGEESKAEESVMPAQSELEYPEPISNKGNEPKLVSLNELSPEEKEEEGFEIEELGEKFSSEGTDTEEALKNLEDQIKDEVEEEEDLWAADVVESEKDSESDELEPISSHKLRAVEEDEVAAEESFESETPEDFPEDVMAEETKPELKPKTEPKTFTPSPSSASAFSNKEREKLKGELYGELSDDISQELSTEFSAKISSQVTESVSETIAEQLPKELSKALDGKLSGLVDQYVQTYVQKYVEEYVQKYCSEQIEKVAWEVIPDLAENIIKREIQKISDSVMD